MFAASGTNVAAVVSRIPPMVVTESADAELSFVV